MYTLLVVLYTVVCLFLVVVVLLQPGRGGMGGAFGSGMGQQVFGGAGPTNILQKVTAVCAALFISLSVALAYLSTSHGSDVDDAIEGVQTTSGTMRSTSTPAEAAPAPASSSSSSTETP